MWLVRSDDMATNKKIKIHVPKLDDIGLVKCGKRGCNKYAPLSKLHNYMTIRNNQYSFVIEIKCSQGHRNRIYI